MTASTTSITTTDGRVFDVPTTFLCPIGQTFMVDPLMTRDGLSFERQAMIAWLRDHNYCPITRRPLQPRDLVANSALHDRLEGWRRSHNVTLRDLGLDDMTEADIGSERVTDGDDCGIAFMSMQGGSDEERLFRQTAFLAELLRRDEGFNPAAALEEDDDATCASSCHSEDEDDLEITVVKKDRTRPRFAPFKRLLRVASP